MRLLREVDELRSSAPKTAGPRPVRAPESILAVLCDMDGTLIASNHLHAAAWCDAFRAHGYPVQPQVIAPLVGMGADKIVPLVAEGLCAYDGLGKSIAEDHKRRFLNGYLRYAQPTSGARELLAAFRKRGVPVFIATSAQGEERDAVLEQAGVRDLVETAPARPTSKPDPDVVQAALAQARVQADRACMIGDTPYDVDAAARAGVPAVAVRCGGWDDRALSGSVAVYDDPADILRHLDDWALPAAGSRIAG